MKEKFYKPVVILAMMYGSEYWQIIKRKIKIKAVETRMLWRMCDMSSLERIKNE